MEDEIVFFGDSKKSIFETSIKSSYKISAVTSSHIGLSTHTLVSSSIDISLYVNETSVILSKFNISEPRRMKYNANIISDVFTRSDNYYRFMNLSEYKIMTFGRNEKTDEFYHTFFKVNFEGIDKKSIIERVYLKLKCQGYYDVIEKFNIITVENTWFEDGITHENQPKATYMLEDFYYSYNSLKQELYIDLTDLIKRRNKDLKEFSFCLIPKSDSKRTYSFYSKESMNKPELVVDYIEYFKINDMFNDLNICIYSKSKSNSDLSLSIEPKQVKEYSDITASLFVHASGYRYQDEISSNIAISRNDLFFTIKPKINSNSNLPFLITGIERKFNDLFSSLAISKNFMLSCLNVMFEEFIPISIYVKQNPKSDLDFSISSSLDELFASFKVKESKDLEFYLDLKGQEVNDLPLSFIVNNLELELSLHVKNSNGLITTLAVKEFKKSEKDYSIVVSNQDMIFFITPKINQSSELSCFLTSAVNDYSDLALQVCNTNKEVPLSIGVVYKKEDDLNFMFKIKGFGESEIYPFISISNEELHSELIVAYQKKSDMNFNIIPIVRRSSDLSFSIKVKKKNENNYAFII